MSEQPVGTGVPEWTIGDRLRKALSVANMKVGEMAEYLEVQRDTVGNYMSGRTHIPGASLKLWAMRTGVPVEWLKSGEAPASGGPDDGAANATKRYQHLALAAA